MEILGLVDVPTWLLLIITCIVLYVIYMTSNFDFFKKIGVDGPKPNPFFGNFHTLMRKGIVDCDLEWYKKYDGLYGTFEGKFCVLNVGRPEMIKDIVVKEFSSFVNRRSFENAQEEPMDKMLTVLKDDHWKFVRHTMTPGFSGRKLRNMMPLIHCTTDRLVENIGTKAKNNEKVELKDLCGAFTLEVIASTGFGIQIDCQKNPDDKFIVAVKTVFKPTILRLLVRIILFFPAIGFIFKYLRLRKKSFTLFTSAVAQTIQHRNENPGDYADLLQQMIDSHKAGEEQDDQEEENTEDRQITKTTWTRKGLTESEVLSQSLLLFLAGYETTSNLLTCILHQFAIDSDTLEKALREVDDVLNGEQPTYDSVRKLTYMDMCLSETLRLHPVSRVDRVAGNDVTVGGIKIPKGTVVAIPIAAVHRDPQYWPEPEKFIPERFTPEEKAARDPYTYLPFGMGPRNCIGLRLALLQAKIALARILQQYKPVKCSRTEIPIKKHKLAATPIDNWIKFEARSQI